MNAPEAIPTQSVASLKNFISIGEAARITSLHPQTLRKFADEGSLRSYRTPGGTRRFDRTSLEQYCHAVPDSKPTAVSSKPSTRINYVYARVSSRKQLDDLSRQTDYLRTFRPEYAAYISLCDVASGINFKRKGLDIILDACIQGSIGELVIAHRDRLCRFGFELLKSFVEKSGGKITVLNDETNKSSEQELAEDLLSIIHIYSCRQMGRRSYRSKQAQNTAIEALPDEGTEGDN
jgi:excisionase family DNA binding protein